MKNLYPKGKGKIHPSPACPSGSTGCGASEDALAMLKLLPAAILALTAALGSEDKEVLTYLMTRSLNGEWMVAGNGICGAGGRGEERRRCRRVGGVHRPLFDCGCFDCYSSFWSRWDCSPDRELIHQAIEAFEEHLANSESKGGGRGRRRERRVSDVSEKGKKTKEKEKKKKVEQITDEKILEVPEIRLSVEEKAAEVEATSGEGDDEKRELEEEVAEDANEEEAAAAAAGGERRRGWPDVMGLFNPRLWNLWSPSA